MTKPLSLSVLLLLIVQFRCFIFQSKAIVKVCPYGWQWDLPKSQCILNCADQNSNCVYRRSFNDTFHPENKTYSVDPANTVMSPTIPSCYNITLTSGQYNVTSDGRYELNHNIPALYPFNVNNSNGNITTCFPLSPQMLQCDVQISSDYQLINGSTLIIPSRNVTAYLGDFYLDNVNGTAFTCSQGVNSSLYSYPRCNYVGLSPEDYFIDSNGVMLIPKANFTVKNAVYFGVNGSDVTVCIPLSVQFLTCPLNFAWQPFQFFVNNNLSLTNHFVHKLYPVDEYFIKSNGDTGLCATYEEIKISPYTNKVENLQTALSALSAVCLIATLIFKFKFYRKNYHTKCLMCHVVCLIFVYISMVIKPYTMYIHIVSCYITYIILYFSYIGAFFWLNVIAFDSWRSFTRMQTSPYFCHCKLMCHRLRLNTEQSRFVCYSVYAWGMAILLTVITMIVEFTPMPREFIFLHPQIYVYCWFNNYPSTIVFYCIPLGILMLANLIFFILTIQVIYHASEGTEFVNHSRPKRTLEVAIKLFIVMGLFWTADIISYSLINFETVNFKVWYITNCITDCQGVAIFLVYFTNKQTLRLICQPIRDYYFICQRNNNVEDDLQLQLAENEIHNNTNTTSSTAVANDFIF
ncbi:hypothetical protein CHUAL_002119 [Chamberlinius hualienensis]